MIAPLVQGKAGFTRLLALRCRRWIAAGGWRAFSSDARGRAPTGHSTTGFQFVLEITGALLVAATFILLMHL